MQTRISGIPCLIKVGYAHIQEPDRSADNDFDYNGHSEIEYTVCDSKGRPAPWLERKMSPSDETRINEEIICWMSETNKI